MMLIRVGALFASLVAFAAPLSAQDSNALQQDAVVDKASPLSSYAKELRDAGATLYDWWGVIVATDTAEAPETLESDPPAPQDAAARDAMAINYSLMNDPEDPDAAMLIALCSQGEIYLAYLPRRMASEAEPQVEAGGSNSLGSAVNEQTEATSWIAARRAGELRMVNLSIDGGDAVIEDWLTTRGRTGVFLYGPRAQKALDRLPQSDVLTLSVAVENAVAESSFDLKGAEAALGALLAACGGARGAAPKRSDAGMRG